MGGYKDYNFFGLLDRRMMCIMSILRLYATPSFFDLRGRKLVVDTLASCFVIGKGKNVWLTGRAY